MKHLPLNKSKKPKQCSLFPKENGDLRSLQWQNKILEESTSEGIPLDVILDREGKNYEDFRYEIDCPTLNKKIPYKPLIDFSASYHGVPVVSFFSGAGGLDLGFEVAGFEHVGSVDTNSLFCETLTKNRPNWKIIGPPNFSGNVSETDELVEDLRRLLGIRKHFEGVFMGGPPCQPFSIAANQRFNKSGSKFKRTGFSHKGNGNLLFDFISLIQIFKPKTFLIENVTGLFDIDAGEQLSQALNILDRLGYNVFDPFILDGKFYSIPQQRLRIFIVGTRGNGAFKIPRPNENIIPCSTVFDMPIRNAKNHETRKHKAESIKRYMKLDVGQRDHLGRVDRLNPSLPSKTIIAGGTAGGGRSHLHPHVPRTLSVRESARLQTFPDNFIFSGPIARQFTQVGNAVSPVLAAQIARSVKLGLF